MKHCTKRSLLAMVLAALMLALFLCGCDKKPTAESLIKGVPEKIGAVDADMSIEMTATLSIEGADADDTQMDVKLNINSNTKSDGVHSRTTGKSITEMLGVSMNTDLDTYVDGDSGITYNWDPELSKWTINDEAETTGDALGFNSFGDNFKNPVLQDEKDENGNYVVTCDLDLAGMGMLNDLSTDAANAKATATLLFDGESQQIKSVSIQAATDGDESTNVMSIILKFNQLGGDIAVEIPTDLPTPGEG